MEKITGYLKNPQIMLDDFAGDEAHFDRILTDMVRNGGDFTPVGVWDVTHGGQDGTSYFNAVAREGTFSRQFAPNLKIPPNIFSDKYQTFRKMLDPWIGCTGLKPIDENLARRYYPVLKPIDSLNLLPTYIDSERRLTTEGKKLLNADLDTLLDVSLINSFLNSEQQSLTVLEVGGGYGRLAEALFNIYGAQSVKYVLIDAVPASLLYAHQYLERKCPDVRIGSFANGDAFDLNRFDCYIIPAWHISQIKGVEFDLCVNISSFQEMPQTHVDHYLKLFDVFCKLNGMIYLSNARDYIFQGQWNFPEKWLCRFRRRTPRAWTVDFPTEIFQKTDKDQTWINKCMESFYQAEVADRRLMAAMEQEKQVLNAEIQRLKDELLTIEEQFRLNSNW